MKYFYIYTILYSLLILSVSGYSQTVKRYDLYVKDTIVNFTGKPKRAIAVNGQIPMPVLEFTEGDTAEIVLHNLLNENTSLHWHGVQLPNREDGVPYLTQMPVKPGETYVYRFPVIQNGTYWYHSHSGLQEQIGMYGSLIFHKKNTDAAVRKGIDDIRSFPVLLSEWTDIKPDNVHRLLHSSNDWFSIRKNAVQSYSEAIREKHFKTKLLNEWKRMQAMDVSDVYYDRFLINGKNEAHFSEVKAGDKIRLRIANAGASSYFWVSYAGGKITVVANDGNDVVPVDVDRLIIGVSETYDIVVTVSEENTAYELLATAEDRSGSASLYIGNGTIKKLPALQKLKYFEGMKMMNDMMKMNGDMDDMGMKMSFQKMDMNAVMYPEITDHKSMSNDHAAMGHDAHAGHNMEKNDLVTLNYGMLKSPVKTTLTDDIPVKELTFTLTGNMDRYVWSMDNKVLSESDKIPVKKGEILRITLYNNSMMRHPMHLHGYDFRIINGQGDYAPLKNVLDIMPMETNVIEFKADAEGDWFFHCHILYHMMSGMNRVFSVGNYVNPLIPDKQMAYKMLQKESNMWHFTAQNDFATNGNDGSMMLQNARWSIGTEWRLGYNNQNGYETETHIGRYLGRMQWLMPFIGFDWRYRKAGHNILEKNLFGQANTKDDRVQLSLGIAYTLPMLIVFQTEVYQNGNVRMQLGREDIPVSKRMRAGFMINTDKEYMGELRYVLTRYMGVRAHYDSDMGWGAGISLNY